MDPKFNHQCYKKRFGIQGDREDDVMMEAEFGGQQKPKNAKDL